MRRFEIINPDHMLLVTQTGVQSASDASCSHGQPAVYLMLAGAHRTSPEQDHRVHALVPRCALTEIIGSLQAQIRLQEGEDALQQFLDEVAAHTEQTAAGLEDLNRQQRDCCEAGFRTFGAEHTCGRNTLGGDRE